MFLTGLPLFSPPGATDPFFGSVQLLLHGDGADASTVFNDSSSFGRTVSALGNAQVDTAQYKFGGASLLFDGTGDALTCDAQLPALGTGDFTVEFWFRTSALTGTLIDFRNTSGTAGPPIISAGTSNAVKFVVGGLAGIQSSAASANVWHHVAMTRQSGTWRCFLDGAQQGTTMSYATSITSTTITIGLPGFNRGSGVAGFNGNIDDLRITYDCRYVANFTPPVAAFPNS